jgi:RNA polymerase sigma-70 factor (ECF subfamily)
MLDEMGFDRLYVDYYPSMLSYARSFVTPEDAEEVVQDVMVWLWENRKTIKINCDFKKYLLRSIRNSCMNRITQGQAQQRLHQAIFEKIQPFYEDVDLYTVEQLTLKIEEALNRLPESYRIVFEKNRFENMTYPMIAEELGISVKSVEYRMSQALKQLRADLKDYLPAAIALLLLG